MLASLSTPDRYGHTSKRRACSGTTPLSSRDRSSRCSTSRPSRSVCCSAVRIVSGSASRDAVHDVLQHRAQRRDRRAQLVRDVGDQLLAVRVHGLQVGRHPVEGLRQLARTRRAARRAPGASSRRAPSPGGVGHLVQRRRQDCATNWVISSEAMIEKIVITRSSVAVHGEQRQQRGDHHGEDHQRAERGLHGTVGVQRAQALPQAVPRVAAQPGRGALPATPERTSRAARPSPSEPSAAAPVTGTAAPPGAGVSSA